MSCSPKNPPVLFVICSNLPSQLRTSSASGGSHLALAVLSSVLLLLCSRSSSSPVSSRVSAKRKPSPRMLFFALILLHVRDAGQECLVAILCSIVSYLYEHAICFFCGILQTQSPGVTNFHPFELHVPLRILQPQAQILLGPSSTQGTVFSFSHLPGYHFCHGTRSQFQKAGPTTGRRQDIAAYPDIAC